MSAAEVAALPLPDGLEPVVRAVAELLVATFGAAPANPHHPQDG